MDQPRTTPQATEHLDPADEHATEHATEQATEQAQDHAAIAQTSMRGSFRSVLRSLIISGLIPLLIYNVLTGRGASQFTALSVAAIPPAIDAVVGVVRQRRVDLISGLALAGIAISMFAILIGGDPRLLLVRESFLTGALGIACFASLFFVPRPLMFYFGRYFASGGDPAKAATFGALWQYDYFRHVMRLITIVWGVAYTGEFLLRIVMAYTLPIPVVLALSPVIFGGITLATIGWTIYYGRLAGRRGAEMRARAMNAAGR